VQSPDGPLIVGDYTFESRLFLGTGKYSSNQIMREAHIASGCDCVTVAVRRVDFEDRSDEAFFNHIDLDRYKILPNTAGCFNAVDAVRTLHLAREALGEGLVKLEVLADERTLLPDPIETLAAAETLVADGFTVLVYTSDDPIMARRLAEIGVAAVMPAGSPIGSGQGVLNPNNIRIIRETVDVPIIIDAGVGTASDVTLAMELGVDGILLNTGVALAKDPVLMARAMGLACVSGRAAYLAGRMPKKLYAQASSPTEGLIAAATDSNK
jgi:thiazole synthase